MSLILISHLRKKAHKIMNWGTEAKIQEYLAQKSQGGHRLCSAPSLRPCVGIPSAQSKHSSQERVIYIEDLPIL